MDFLLDGAINICPTPTATFPCYSYLIKLYLFHSMPVLLDLTTSKQEHVPPQAHIHLPSVTTRKMARRGMRHSFPFLSKGWELALTIEKLTPNVIVFHQLLTHGLS